MQRGGGGIPKLSEGRANKITRSTVLLPSTKTHTNGKREKEKKKREKTIMEVVLGTLELSWEISRHVIPVALICRPKLSITKVKLLLLYGTNQTRIGRGDIKLIGHGGNAMQMRESRRRESLSLFVQYS